MADQRLSSDDFKAKIQEYKQKEFEFLNDKVNLHTFLHENGWKEKTSMRKDQEIWGNKGEEVIVSFNKRASQWQWRAAEQSEDVSYRPYKLAMFMVKESTKANPIDRFKEDNQAKDMMRENLANIGIDLRKAFPQYVDVIDFLEKKGGNYPVLEAGSKRQVDQTQKVKVEAPSMEVYRNDNQQEATRKPNPENSLKEFLLNEVSLFKYISHLGYKATEYKPKSHIPTDIVYEVKRKAGYALNNSGLSVIESIAKDHLPDLVKVSDTLFQATNPVANVSYKSLLIDVENNRFEDKAMKLEGGPLELLVAVKGMKFDQAVRTLAEVVRVEIPEVKQQSTSVYYVNNDHAVKIYRNEDTGRYYYYDTEANTKGTALDIIKEIMSAQKGIENIPDRDAMQPLIKFGLSTLDGDKLEKLNELVSEAFPAKSASNGINSQLAAQVARKQPELQNGIEIG